MRGRVAAALLALTLSGCGDLLEEHICGDGEYPVRPLDGGLGGQCVKDGEQPPAGLEAYPAGQVPEIIGDKWDTYWSEQATKVTRNQQVKEALTGLVPADKPQGWKRTDIGEIGSIAAPANWAVDRKGSTIRLARGKAYVEVALEPDAAAELDVRADEIRDAGTETTDPVFDVDTLATWPGGTDARYLRMSRGVLGEDGFTSSEALLVADEDASLVIVKGVVEGKEINLGSIPSRILRTLVLRGL